MEFDLLPGLFVQIGRLRYFNETFELLKLVLLVSVLFHAILIWFKFSFYLIKV